MENIKEIASKHSRENFVQVETYAGYCRYSNSIHEIEELFLKLVYSVHDSLVFLVDFALLFQFLDLVHNLQRLLRVNCRHTCAGRNDLFA